MFTAFKCHFKHIIKMKKLLVLYFSILNFSAFLQAQTCTDFIINSVMPDSTEPNSFQISIQNNRNASDMVNYPHVAFITNCNADTVANGTLFWFGQFGQTTQDYPVTLSGIGSITCLPLTAYFVFSDNSGNTDTCQLIYSSTNIYNQTSDKGELIIYPNPSTTQIFIKINEKNRGAKFNIFNSTGKTVISGFLNNENSLDISTLDNGVYFLNLENHKIKTFSVLKN
jgi:hypothetical protein